MNDERCVHKTEINHIISIIHRVHNYRNNVNIMSSTHVQVFFFLVNRMITYSMIGKEFSQFYVDRHVTTQTSYIKHKTSMTQLRARENDDHIHNTTSIPKVNYSTR